MSTNQALKGSLTIPGDKSITHRALIFSAFTRGSTFISGLSPAEDCRSTVRCLQSLGVYIRHDDETTCHVRHDGSRPLRAPGQILDAGNSGTTIRLLSALVAAQPIKARFDGDSSLRKRPMARVLDPLAEMGASVQYLNDSGKPPFILTGTTLIGRSFDLKVASAQVQTAILLAGLKAQGRTSVCLPSPVRDHTLRMFSYLGIPFEASDTFAAVTTLSEPVEAKDMRVPGDISSAAFFMVAASVVPGSDVTLKNVGMNPGRTLIVDVLKRMGANIEVINVDPQCGEPVADIRVRHSGRLGSATISGAEIATGIDEMPVLALAGAVADGTLVVTGAEELRHKESDRLKAIVNNMQSLGADIEELEDGFSVSGKSQLPGGGIWRTYHDHRLAMTGLVAQLIALEPMEIEETASAAVSYPRFEQDLRSLLD